MSLDWLNYHHLLYFWTVVREGTISRAAEKLHLGQPTISTQLRQLEQSLGTKLFEKSGRKLQLTDAGQTVFRYADEIFSLGQELLDTIHGRPTGQPQRFVVGIVDVMPKLIAKRLLDPAMQLPEMIRLVCVEDTLDRLLSELALHHVDIVLSDTPVNASMMVRAFNHRLGESKIGIFGSPELAAQFRPGFPQSLASAPFLLQHRSTAIRRSLDSWFDLQGIRPMIRAEFADSALLKVYGQSGEGLFAAPVVIRRELCEQHDVEFLGEIPSIRELYYAISAERRLKHPAVLAISSTAREDLFAQ